MLVIGCLVGIPRDNWSCLRCLLPVGCSGLERSSKNGRFGGCCGRAGGLADYGSGAVVVDVVAVPVGE